MLPVELKRAEMKKLIVFLILSAGIMACDNEDRNTVEDKLDSFGEKLDSLGERIDTTAEKIWDTTKAKAKDLKEEVKEEWKERKERRDTVDK